MSVTVSIITPAWNAEKYIAEAIRSVQAQTFSDWEMIIVDDCSDDRTAAIAWEYAAADARIRVMATEKNSGAATARNLALTVCGGRYIAYLDADDLWMPEKLQKQLAFLRENNAAFCCNSYEVIADDGRRLNKTIRMKPRLDYRGFLTHNLLQTAGIMVDTAKIDRGLLEMPNFRRRQDAAAWLQVLKAGFDCYGMDEVLSQYRRTADSLSSDKLRSAMGVWSLYRHVEKLSLPFSCYCFARYASLAVWKRMYPRKDQHDS